MLWDVFHIEQIAKELNAKLRTSRLIEVFSTSKEDIFFVFSSEAVLRLSFYKGQCFFQFPELEKLPKKNRLNQLPEIIKSKVNLIRSYPLDRIFYIDFEADYKLCFYLFGRFSQISLYKKEDFVSHFPLNSKEVEDMIAAKKELVPSSMDEAFSKYHWLTEADRSYMETQQFDTSSDKSSLWTTIIEGHKATKWGIFKDGKYSLGAWSEDCIGEYYQILDAVHDISSLVISTDSFETQKRTVIAEHQRKISLLSKKKKDVLRNLEAVKSEMGFRAKGDLLMANMHSIKKGQTSVRLTSFEGDKEIDIKLDPSKTPQHIAEKFYRKAKNEKLRTSFLNNRLKSIELELKKVNSELDEIKEVNSIKQLKGYLKASSEIRNQKRLPYKVFTIEGHEVRVGKSAKDNDELLRTYSSSHDMWFHAKSVSGSHVILRINKNEKPNDYLIEKVAAIAAYYSKSKNEELARVIYSYRKFVRKPRKAVAGAVIVENERSLLVKPSLEI